jgi:SprT protein
MIVPSSVQRDVEVRIQEGINKASEHFGRKFKFPTLSYDVKGKTAGYATYQKNHIRLNAQLLIENKEKFIARTVPHELGHLITWEVYKDDPSFRSYKRIAHHGSHWKRVCRIIGMDDVTRTHSYDVSKSTARKNKQYVWQCNNCGDLMSVSKAKHTKMLGGHYHHKCGSSQKGSISFVVSPGNYTKMEAIQVVRDSMTKKESAALRDLMQEVKKPEEKKVRKPRKSGMSNMARARSFVRKNPGLSSAQIRSWCEASLGVSAHGARAIYSKLKKEGLV